jgi:recombination associated protein RdgC
MQNCANACAATSGTRIVRRSPGSNLTLLVRAENAGAVCQSRNWHFHRAPVAVYFVTFFATHMRFKNLCVYRLAPTCQITDGELEKILESHALQPCGSLEMESRGWISPHGHDERLLYTLHGHWLIGLGVEQKILPASVIRQIAADRAADIAKNQPHPVGRKQMRDIRQRVTDELLPRALARRQSTLAWIDMANRCIIVDSAADARAERVLETLRKSGADIPAKRLETHSSPASAMTAWVGAGAISPEFSIDRDLELRAADDNKATVRYVRHNLEGQDIRAHITSGKTATRLGMTWKDKISFVLTETLQIKRIEFLSLLTENNGADAENEEERYALDFMLMTGELSLLLADLIQLLGGENKSTQNDQQLRTPAGSKVPALQKRSTVSA